MSNSQEVRKLILNRFITKIIKSKQFSKKQIIKPRIKVQQLIKKARLQAPKHLNLNPQKFAKTRKPLIYKPARLITPITQIKPLSSLKRLQHFIVDNSVLSLECPGPNKPIILNKSGTIITSNISLNKQEIDSIIKEFADKTKIPVIEGTFKALLGRLLITAVISEFVGTRFIIQKRMHA